MPETRSSEELIFLNQDNYFQELFICAPNICQTLSFALKDHKLINISLVL